jgi:putative endonuclease
LSTKAFWVYILASRNRTLYIGVTNSLQRRVLQHKEKLVPGFTQKYNVTQLVYFQQFTDIRYAIRREKQIKGWLRSKKIELIETDNPEWEDLALKLFPPFPTFPKNAPLSS